MQVEDNFNNISINTNITNEYIIVSNVNAEKNKEKNKLEILVEIKKEKDWGYFKTYSLKTNLMKYNSMLYYLDKSDAKYPVYYNNSYWNICNKLQSFFKCRLLPADSFYSKTVELNIFDELSLCWTSLYDLCNYSWNDTVKLENINEELNLYQEDKIKYIFSYIYHISKIIKEDINKFTEINNLNDVRLIIF